MLRGRFLAGCTTLVGSSVPPCQAMSFSLWPKQELKPLQGQKALVFGGTSGIGYATVLRLQEAGATVVAISRNPGKASDLDTRACDVQDVEKLQKLFEEEGPFDILISAATGGPRAIGPFLEMDMEGYKGSFAKLWGYANVVRFGWPYIRAGGCVVLISGSPARSPKRGQIALASVGAAVERFAKTVAPELAAQKVRINVVSPGKDRGLHLSGCEEREGGSHSGRLERFRPYCDTHVDQGTAG